MCRNEYIVDRPPPSRLTAAKLLSARACCDRPDSRRRGRSEDLFVGDGQVSDVVVELGDEGGQIAEIVVKEGLVGRPGENT